MAKGQPSWNNILNNMSARPNWPSKDQEKLDELENALRGNKKNKYRVTIIDCREHENSTLVEGEAVRIIADKDLDSFHVYIHLNTGYEIYLSPSIMDEIIKRLTTKNLESDGR